MHDFVDALIQDIEAFTTIHQLTSEDSRFEKLKPRINLSASLLSAVPDSMSTAQISNLSQYLFGSKSLGQREREYAWAIFKMLPVCW